MSQGQEKAIQPYELHNRDMKIRETKLRIYELFDSAFNSNGVRCGGMRKLKNIPEVRQLRNDSTTLEHLVRLQNG